VAIVADQRARKMGLEVEFLWRPAATTSAPAILALRSRAALIPVFIAFDGKDGYQVNFEDEIEVPGGLSRSETIKEITIRINRVLEKRIMVAPELWMWGHRRWLNPGK
jgi:KDO2-lipid IV(A) lauroyltransferase